MGSSARATASRLAGFVLTMAAVSSVLIPGVDAEEPPVSPRTPLVFRDTAAEAGLLPAAAGIRGHGAGWGDLDENGWPDLYVATFHTDGSRPNLLFRNAGGRFRPDEQPAPGISTRATGVVFADLDNDGDLELYVGSMPAPEGSPTARRAGRSLAGCSLFRNDGGRFTNISGGNGACPPAFGGRSAAVLDFDGDGLLDLLVGEDPLPGYNGSTSKSSRLFRNRGGLRFEDVSRAAGVPEGIPGLGVAAGDVNDDGWPDFFLASSGGGNRLFLNRRDGTFREAPGTREVFAWPDARGDNMVCGVCLGDVNRDGRLDLALGQHYERPWLQPVPNRLYLNRGVTDGVPRFEDVTERVGLAALPMKSPHVELQDIDNDGWPDLYTSLVKLADGRAHPVVFRHQGIREGLPRFREEALAVNDFPTAEDRAIQRSGPLFEKMVRERKVFYSAPGPTADYDRDGRLDMFLPSWWPGAPSLLLHNETKGGHWLAVSLRGKDGVNRQGVGARVELYPAGRLGEKDALLGCREIAVGYGYASGQQAEAHFGLGAAADVDLRVVLPHGKGVLERKQIRAGQRLVVSQ